MPRPEEVDADKVIGQFLSEGLSVAEIALEHSVEPSTVYAILESNGIPVRPEGRVVDKDPELDGLIEEYYKSSDPMEVIAARWGTSVPRLYREIGRRGMSVRKRRGRRGRASVASRELRNVVAQVLVDD